VGRREGAGGGPRFLQRPVRPVCALFPVSYALCHVPCAQRRALLRGQSVSGLAPHSRLMLSRSRRPHHSASSTPAPSAPPSPSRVPLLARAPLPPFSHPPSLPPTSLPLSKFPPSRPPPLLPLSLCLEASKRFTPRLPHGLTKQQHTGTAAPVPRQHPFPFHYPLPFPNVFPFPSPFRRPQASAVLVPGPRGPRQHAASVSSALLLSGHQRPPALLQCTSGVPQSCIQTQPSETPPLQGRPESPAVCPGGT